MTERPSGNQHDNGQDNLQRAKDTVEAGLLGGLSGLISYGITRFLSDHELAEKVGTGVGGALAASSIGVRFSLRSMQEAVEYAEQNKTVKSRLKTIQADLEAAVGLGAAAAITGFEAGGLKAALIGAGTGALIGGLGTHLTFSEGLKDLPEIIPEGNSTTRDNSFPEWKDGKRLSPVYRVSSIEDLKEFRSINKESIVKNASNIARKSNSPGYIDASWMTAAVIIIPNLQHYPIEDPQINTVLGVIKQESSDMKISDSTDSLFVHPCPNSENFWPSRTIFENAFAGTRSFDEDKWRYWRETSWKYGAIILVQYQNPDIVGDDPEKIVDNYWLLDIEVEDEGLKKKRRKGSPEPNTKLEPIPGLLEI